MVDFASSGGSEKRMMDATVGNSSQPLKLRLDESLRCVSSSFDGAKAFELQSLSLVGKYFPERFRSAESPMIDGTSDGILSADETRVMREALVSSPQEWEAVEFFMRTVERASGSQKEVDRILRADNPDWSESRVQSLRSAQIGRLSDLGLLSVEGRGQGAMIHVTDEGADFLRPEGRDES